MATSRGRRARRRRQRPRPRSRHRGDATVATRRSTDRVAVGRSTRSRWARATGSRCTRSTTAPCAQSTGSPPWAQRIGSPALRSGTSSTRWVANPGGAISGGTTRSSGSFAARHPARSRTRSRDETSRSPATADRHRCSDSGGRSLPAAETPRGRECPPWEDASRGCRRPRCRRALPPHGAPRSRRPRRSRAGASAAAAPETRRARRALRRAR